MRGAKIHAALPKKSTNRTLINNSTVIFDLKIIQINFAVYESSITKNDKAHSSFVSVPLPLFSFVWTD